MPSSALTGEPTLTLPELARQYRERLKDKSYRAFPLGQESGHYLRFKRKRLTKDSYRDYEAGLDKLARHFPDLELADFEPPVGRERLEEFLDLQWGHRSPRTYNKNLSILTNFFRFQVLRGKLHGDPTLGIERAKARGFHRETFTADQRRAILAENSDLRDRLALRLVLDYALRKGTLRQVQFRHFDHTRRRLTAFTKGGKVQTVPIPHADFWRDLDLLTLLEESQPHFFLLPTSRTRPSAFERDSLTGKMKATEFTKTLKHEEPMGPHGLHSWWYRCLARAGVVGQGIENGERMHKARHTAGQRVLDVSGNLKAVQRLLGHSSIQTTGDQYVDWDLDQLTETLAEAIEEDE